MPWLDPTGRFSPFKLGVFLLLFVPACLIAQRYAMGELGARPLNEAIHQIGNWALKLLVISLAITPGRQLLRWPRLMQVRRMIGVAAFAYVVAHVALYAVEQGLDLPKVAREIVLRIYLTIGFLVLLVLAAMAATSTNGMIKRLGGRRWRRLHALVYPASLLALVHFFMQTKFDVGEPWIMTGLLFWLMAWRVVVWRRLADGRYADWWPLGLTLLAALVTAGGEALYYWLQVGVAPGRLLQAHFMLTPSLRPAWYVLAIGLAVALAVALRRLAWRRNGGRRGGLRGGGQHRPGIAATQDR